MGDKMHTSPAILAIFRGNKGEVCIKWKKMHTFHDSSSGGGWRAAGATSGSRDNGQRAL